MPGPRNHPRPRPRAAAARPEASGEAPPAGSRAARRAAPDPVHRFAPPVAPPTAPWRRRGSVARGLLLVLGLGAALLTLAWFDVLPGGWTLRGWVKPHAEREAERWAQHRAERLAAFAAEPAPAPGSVVFLGSSTMERFPLAESFPGAPCVDRGVGMEDATRLLRRVPVSVPADAGGVVVYAGSIDFRVEGVPAEVLRERVERVLDAIERAAPDADVLLLGLLPERTWDPARQDRLARANGALADLATARGATFLDPARPPLVTPEGALVREHSADELHLSASGYAVLAGRLLEEGGPVGARLAADPGPGAGR